MTTRLPVIGSTAATTAFCSATVEGPGLGGSTLRLHFDGNGKIAAGNGTLAEPRPNALSTVQVEDCPQSTPTCRKTCYVHNLEAAQKATHDLYRENSAALRAIVADPELACAWSAIVGDWIKDNAPHGFRWHVSGDVFSLAHAHWIADVCRRAAPVRCWIYTRSFAFVAPLWRASTAVGGNLAVNLSCDQDNYEAAKRVVKMFASHAHNPMLGVDGGVMSGAEVAHRALAGRPIPEPTRGPRLCYLVVEGDKPPEDLGPDDVIFPDYALRPRAAKTFEESEWWQSISQFQRGLVCPADAVGKSEKIRCGIPGDGHCSRCTS